MNKQILMLGLPATGKTSFLAALHYYLGEETPDGKLLKDKMSPNEDYLNALVERWLDCEEQHRTNQLGHEDLQATIYLRSTQSDRRFVLDVPDIKGEAFVEHLLHRTWSLTYKKQVDKSSGILFFIHPKKIKPHVLMSDVPLGDETFNPPKAADSQASSPSTDTGIQPDYSSLESAVIEIDEWNPTDSPTQVNLVEILQLHLEYIPMDQPVPILFVLSAWDELIDLESRNEPKNWLYSNMPLLKQFLEANAEKMVVGVMGVSAQGGDYKNKGDREQIEAKENPIERIQVDQGNETEISSDITLPLQWIMDQWTINKQW